MSNFYMQTNLVFRLALLFRYDPDLARFEDPPSDEVEISENLKRIHVQIMKSSL
jgi:hypothetical protein